ncbi:glutaminyl-peptide cyclotransferase [Aureivirga sp. CE67]|uniref:glutaminyl-peptide cyclotransferase n=1 Tax=Aureivirga sp. CE67 TaxID=1788983 RepID=UPI0018CB7135|nr:glutaminyl-peptide cyclotransferase [Aureivirga sp. CE67]
MSIKYLFTVGVAAMLFASCTKEYKFKLTAPKKIQTNKALNLSINEENNQPVDSVQFSIDGKKLPMAKGTSTLVDINGYKLGKHAISAVVFYENKTKKLVNTAYFLSSTPFLVMDFEIVNVYPHDPKAYTQGLEYRDGFLYEGTGQYGESSVRKVELKTGKVLEQYDLPKQYFGEGITIFNDKIFQLTWKKGIGFVRNLETFEEEGTFKYGQSREGWGLTNDGKKLIKSDGTEKIWFLNGENQKEEGYIEAYTNTRKVEKINELEYVKGKIYANVWQQNSILIINEETGAIEAVANMTKLAEKMNIKDKQDDVLNGIAYDKENDRLFVTGKRWDKLFEIKLKKR